MERLPCDPEIVGTERCALYRKIGKCFIDVHHLYHPRKDYKTPVEKQFRELDENKVEMCRDWHNADHAVFAAPTKPVLEAMQATIEKKHNRGDVPLT